MQQHLKQMSAAGIACAAWFALTTQIYFNVMHALAENGAVILTLTNFFSYFTIETNLTIAVVLTFSLSRRSHPVLSSHSVRSALVVYIIIVGVVYSYMLSHLYRPEGWQYVANGLMHWAIPVLYPVYWLAFIEKGTLRWTDPLRWLIFPLAFFIYSMARGAAFGVYPYPFIDAARLGYAGVGFNALVLFFAFLGLGVFLTALDQALAQKRHPAAQPSLQNSLHNSWQNR
jgi:hypothetical protein